VQDALDVAYNHCIDTFELYQVTNFIKYIYLVNE